MPTLIRTRLSLSFLLVLLLGMGLAAALVWITVERLYLDTLSENLLAEARLSAQALRGESLTNLASDPYSQTTNALPGIHTHFLAEQDATVLALPITADTPSQRLPLVENNRSISSRNLLQRSEIASALHGTPATAVRQVASARNRRILYAAAPVLDEDGNVAGLVYLATPLPSGGLPASVILQLAGTVIIAALLAMGAAALLSRRVARPIEIIARAANKVAKGDLNQQVPTDRSIQELESLGQSFNAMTAGLRQSEQAKNAFLGNVTHELRTPLTVIKGTIETLEDGAIDDAEGRGPLLNSMERETERLIRLVNDLLVLTRSDAGALKLDLKPLDLGKLASNRCEILAPIAHDKGVALRVEAGEHDKVWGDEDRLAQVFDNLLGNAIRHSRAGSTVTIHVQLAGGEIMCSIRDSGSGIPTAHLPFIFERFYRADASRNRQSGGSGLGLSIVRALVQAHGGRITADSIEGEGTTITFWLPIAS
jgi:two-component system sensor histidine kinase BaeS